MNGLKLGLPQAAAPNVKIKVQGPFIKLANNNDIFYYLPAG